MCETVKVGRKQAISMHFWCEYEKQRRSKDTLLVAFYSGLQTGICDTKDLQSS